MEFYYQCSKKWVRKCAPCAPTSAAPALHVLAQGSRDFSIPTKNREKSPVIQTNQYSNSYLYPLSKSINCYQKYFGKNWPMCDYSGGEAAQLAARAKLDCNTRERTSQGRRAAWLRGLRGSSCFTCLPKTEHQSTTCPIKTNILHTLLCKIQSISVQFSAIFGIFILCAIHSYSW